MHYLVLLGVGVASWRLTERGAWDSFWYGFVALLVLGSLAEWADVRRQKRKREAANRRRREARRKARYDV